MRNTLINQVQGAGITTLQQKKNWLIDWYFSNDLMGSIYLVTLRNPALVSNYQTNPGMLYGAPFATGMENYFQKIKNYFGQSMFDQLVTEFAQQSNLYVDEIKVDEFHLYGSSRLGVYEANRTISRRVARDLNNDKQITNNEYVVETPEEVLYLYSIYPLERGAKRYELANHLGNVLTVISDKKTANFTGSTFTHFTADRISATDYSPFGAPLAGRTWNGGEYRYGFNGKENDNEIIGFANIIDFGERILDSRLGKFLTIDPLYRKFPMFSPFQFASNSPVAHIDLDGLEGILAIFKGDFKGFWDGWKNYRNRNSNTGTRASEPEQMPNLISPPVNSTFTFGSNVTQFGNGVGFAQLSRDNREAISLVVGTLLQDPSSIITIQGTSNINVNNADARSTSALSAILLHPSINSGLDNQNQIQSRGGVIVDNNNNPVLDNFGSPIQSNRIIILPSLVGPEQPLTASLTAIPATPIVAPDVPKRKSVIVEFFKYVFGNVNVKNGFAKNRGDQSDVNK